MDSPLVVIIVRVLHISGAAGVLIGFITLALIAVPAMRDVPAMTADPIIRAIRRRATAIAWAGAVAQFITGTWGWIVLAPHYRQVGPVADILLGTKVLLATLVVAVLFAQVESNKDPRPGLWPTLLRVGLVLSVFVLGAIVRQLRVLAAAEGF